MISEVFSINHVFLLILFCTSAWVLIDAKDIGVQAGQIKGIANMRPFMWFILCLLLWIVGFPLYLAKRGEYKRVNGKPGGSRITTFVGLGLIAVSVVTFIRTLTGDINMISVNFVIVFCTSAWVLIDAEDIGVQTGQIKGIANMRPFMWFILCLLLWIVGFPLYLAKRGEYKRVNGKPGGSRITTFVGLGLIAVSVVTSTVALTGDIKMSTIDLQAQVEQHIAETFAQEPGMASVKIINLFLEHKGRDQYQGILTVEQDGELSSFTLDVIYDGESFMWKLR